MGTEAIEADASTRWELAATWLVVQLGLTAIAFVHTLLSTLSIASCTATSCDYSAFSAAINTSYIGTVVLLLSSALAMILLRKHARARVWAPITGIFLLLLLQAVTYTAGRAALTLPLFGNRLPGCC